MNIMIDKEVRPYLNDRGIMNQIQYAVNQMMARKEETINVYTTKGVFYVYRYEETIYVMNK